MTAGFENEAAIKVSNTQSLSYLNATVNETLRLHHPTPGNLPRIVPKSGMVIDGAFVPGDTVVGVSLHNIHTRHENFYLPLEFHPERFLDSTSPFFDKRFANDSLDAYAPFSMGPRNCIGSK
jgi:cytochrome P450